MNDKTFAQKVNGQNNPDNLNGTEKFAFDLLKTLFQELSRHSKVFQPSKLGDAQFEYLVAKAVEHANKTDVEGFVEEVINPLKQAIDEEVRKVAHA